MIVEKNRPISRDDIEFDINCNEEIGRAFQMTKPGVIGNILEICAESEVVPQICGSIVFLPRHKIEFDKRVSGHTLHPTSPR